MDAIDKLQHYNKWFLCINAIINNSKHIKIISAHKCQVIGELLIKFFIVTVSFFCSVPFEKRLELFLCLSMLQVSV